MYYFLINLDKWIFICVKNIVTAGKYVSVEDQDQLNNELAQRQRQNVSVKQIIQNRRRFFVPVTGVRFSEKVQNR
jgi:hypothetical protein